MKKITNLNEMRVGNYYSIYELKPKRVTIGVLKKVTPPRGEFQLYGITDSPHTQAVYMQNTVVNVWEGDAPEIFELDAVEAYHTQGDIDEWEQEVEANKMNYATSVAHTPSGGTINIEAVLTSLVDL